MAWFSSPEAWAALATLTVLVGTALIAEGIDLHIPKGYIYFAMAFSVVVEMKKQP